MAGAIKRMETNVIANKNLFQGEAFLLPQLEYGNLLLLTGKQSCECIIKNWTD